MDQLFNSVTFRIPVCKLFFRTVEAWKQATFKLKGLTTLK